MCMAKLPTDPQVEPYWDPSNPKAPQRFYIRRLVEDQDRPRCSKTEYLHTDLMWRPSVSHREAQSGLYDSETEANATIVALTAVPTHSA